MSKSKYYSELIKQLAIDIIKLCSNIPLNITSKIIISQITRSSTSAAANYRAVCRARSKLDFIAKLGLVEEELDETLYWLEILRDTGIIHKDKLSNLISTANRLIGFTIVSQKTAKQNPKSRDKNLLNQTTKNNKQSTIETEVESCYPKSNPLRY